MMNQEKMLRVNRITLAILEILEGNRIALINLEVQIFLLHIERQKKLYFVNSILILYFFLKQI